MSEDRRKNDRVICPECKGRGMIRPEGEWANETCPTCNGRGPERAYRRRKGRSR